MLSHLEKIVDMGPRDQYILVKSNYMPINTLRTLQEGESLIVLPESRLTELLSQVRDKSKAMIEKPDYGNQEKLVSELIRIDSDDSDSENNMLKNGAVEASQTGLNSQAIQNWMQENPESRVSFREPSFNDLNQFAI